MDLTEDGWTMGEDGSYHTSFDDDDDGVWQDEVGSGEAGNEVMERLIAMRKEFDERYVSTLH